jgi:plasmid maintenance system antidote protein VapI
MSAELTTPPQGELALARRPRRGEVAQEIVRAQKTAAAAFTLACSASGLDDKEIYLALGIDAGYFSNIKKGKATLQADLIARFCDVVGNAIYVEWIAYQIGCALMLVKSEAERRAEAEKARADAAESRLAYLEDLFKRRAVA